MRKLLLMVLVLSAVVLAASACGGKTQGTHFTIAVKAIPPWHIFDTQKIEFAVTDKVSGKGKAGLSPVVQMHQRGTEQVTTWSLEKGQVIDQGNGAYTLEFTPAAVSAYALVVRFTQNGEESVSAPVAFDTSRAGEDGIKAEVGGKAYVYQVRYAWEPAVVPGHVFASDKDKVRLVFEIMRGIQEGNDIDWKEPWLNLFDHITNADRPAVLLKSMDGKVSQEIQARYMGRGVYQAERLFTIEEVGKEMRYESTFVFTDPYNGAKVKNSKPFSLHASAPH